MELAIEFAVGFSTLIIGLSYILHPDDWRSWMLEMRVGGRQKSLSMGMVGLGISALIVGFHPIFEGKALIVTIIGILGMIEGMVYLLAPNVFPLMLTMATPTRNVTVRIMGAVIVLLALVILCSWWDMAY